VSEHRETRRPGGRADERGIVAVWTALLMVVIIGFTAWAVDFGNWKDRSTRLQKAADAAALAGVVFMPENLNSMAFTTARSIASKNGYTDGQDGVTVTVAPGQQPNQLSVTITQRVQNIFAPVIGVATTDVTRHADAEYQRPVSMGSPVNQFGNDPTTASLVHGSVRYPDFWTNVFGPASKKTKGDAIQSTICDGADNCSGSNTDYDPNGYFYAIDVGATSGPLQVQAYDPEFANVGDNCGNNDTTPSDPVPPAVAVPGPGSNLVGAAALPPNFNPAFPVADPATRYGPAANSPYCNGDQYFGEGKDLLPWTVYKLRAPDLTPGDPSDNPVICSIEFPGYRGDLAAALKAATPQAGAPDLFVSYFRQWYTLCTVNNPEVGTYFLQVETNTKIDGSAAPFGGGANRFALRAGLGGNMQTPSVKVYGSGRIGIYANSPAANTTFYLARVLPGAKGRTLVMSFFDVGDAAQAGAITVLPPTDSNVAGGAFPGCTFTAPPGNSTGPPWGPFTATSSGCQVTNVSNATFNGQWVQLRIPIPDDYTCNYNDALGCWSRVNFAFPAAVQDTTTWSAQMTGDPVRIIG
jgi:Flp pilus assembly protein TadG